MKKLSVIIIACTLLVACKNKVHNSVPRVNNVTISSEEQEYRAMERADKELRDSIGSKYHPDENGICEGAPDFYKATNVTEKMILTSLNNYFEAAMANDVSKAKSYICPKVVSIIKKKAPQYSNENIDEIIASIIAEFSGLNEIFQTQFEAFKKVLPIASELHKLPSKEGCLIYSVHYSILILCTEDDENYFSWHIPSFMYAASPDNGQNWYFIELTEYTDEVLKDFR